MKCEFLQKNSFDRQEKEKRFFSRFGIFFFTGILLFGLKSAFTQTWGFNGITYNVTSNTAPLTAEVFVNSSVSGVVNIPQTVFLGQTQYTVTGIGNHAFMSANGLTGVVIPNTVVNIGNSAFLNCTNLTSITLPTSLISIGENAFSNTGLTSVVIPNSVTNIGESAFQNCSNLSSVTLSNSLTGISENMFRACTSITSIDIPNSVTSIGQSAFEDCENLSSVDFPNSITSFGESAFRACSSLTTVVLPNSLTTISEFTFGFCTSLSSIVIPNSVTTIQSNAFAFCSNLTSIDLPNSITNFGPAPFFLSGLTSINLPNSLSTVSAGLFYYCLNLTSVTLHNSILSIEEYAFYECPSLNSIEIPSSVTSIGESAFDGCVGLSTFKVNWSTPLTIDGTVFANVDLSNVSLIVPAGVESLYQNAAIWEDFNWPTSCVLATGTDVISSCGPVTWIDGNTYSSTNNTATHLLVGAAQGGCDSLVTLNLTVWNCTQLQPGSCGASGVAMNQTLRALNVSAPAYRFKVTGVNNGGSGWNNNTFVYESPNRSMKFAFVPGCVWGQSYMIEVAVGDGNGNWSPYGNSCAVELGTIPTSQMDLLSCGATVSLNTSVFANRISGSSAYRFRMIGQNSENWTDNTFILTKTQRKFKMSEAIGCIPGETYTVEVAVQSASGIWGDYGSSCFITIEGSPEMMINDSEIVLNDKTSVALSFQVNASENPFTNNFGIQVLNANEIEQISVEVYDMSGKLIEIDSINPLDIENTRLGSDLTPGMYLIKVKQGSNQVVIRQVKN